MADARSGWEQCGAHCRTTGEPCRSPKVIGAQRCRMHSGTRDRAGNARRAALAGLEQAAARYGFPVTISAADALQQDIERTQGLIVYLEAHLRDVGAGELVERISTEHTSGDLQQHIQRVDAAIGVWVELFLKERQHLHQISRTALSVGLQEKRLRVDQRYAEAFEAAFLHVLVGLGRNPQDGESRALLSSAFTVAEQTLDASDAIPGKVIR